MTNNDLDSMERYVEDIVGIGLTRGEAKVYLSMVQISPSTVGKIVESSRVSHSKIYNVLNRLVLKGLFSYNIQNNSRYFQSLEPARLYGFILKKEVEIKEKKEQLAAIVAYLSMSANAHKRSTSEIFIGEKILRSAYIILLGQSKKGDILRYFYPYPKAHRNATPFYYRFYRYQKSKKITERGIVTHEFRNSDHFKEIPKDVKLRYVNFPLPGTIDILWTRF